MCTTVVFVTALLFLPDVTVRAFHLHLPQSRRKQVRSTSILLDVQAPLTSQQEDYELDSLVDWVTNTKASRPVIREYKPDAWWLWTRWNGTVRKLSVTPVLITIAINVSLMVWADDEMIRQLGDFKTPWEYLLSLCTLILSFFTSQAYTHWKTVYSSTRAIQGRINDICLLLVLGAERTGGTYSDDARRLIDVCTRLIRVSHVLFWASTPTSAGMAKDGDEFVKHGNKLLTPEGLERLVAKGQLTKEELSSLGLTGLPSSQYPFILLEWVGLYAVEGLRDGTLLSCGDGGLEQNILQQVTALRGEYFNIGDYKAGRMPLAYVQLVQILVDWVVYLAPFALNYKLGAFCTPLSALFVLFFKGLLEVSKSFLDPFGAEGYPGQNIRVDVLVAEMNYGASTRWIKGGEVLPPISEGGDTD